VLIAGIIAAAIGVVLFFVGKSQQDKVYQMKSTETSSVDDLVKLAHDVDRELGPASFNHPAELKGQAKSDNPLRAEMSGTECVWYSVSVTREYEEQYYETDSEGRRELKTRRGSEVVSGNTRGGPFLLDDGTGSIEIDPEGAAIEGIRTFDRFQNGEGTGVVSFGAFSFDFGRLLQGTGRRTIGYRYEETSVPAGRRLYVLGEASTADGRLRVRKPGAKGARYIVSTRSEEDLVRAAESGAKWLGVGSIVLVVAGVVLLVLDLFKGPLGL
jgi:hypothetical protein